MVRVPLSFYTFCFIYSAIKFACLRALLASLMLEVSRYNSESSFCRIQYSIPSCMQSVRTVSSPDLELHERYLQVRASRVPPYSSAFHSCTSSFVPEQPCRFLHADAPITMLTSENDFYEVIFAQINVPGTPQTPTKLGSICPKERHGNVYDAEASPSRC